MQTSERVRLIIADHLAVDQEKVTDDAHLIDDLGGDSLDCVEITMAFEEEWPISIDDDEASKASTVGNWIALIDRKLAEKA
jgi:acyl carrier protein